MWTLVGPFDGEVVADMSFKKVKWLQAGKKYMLGRKDRPLVINHKKISRDHLQFTVGDYPAQDTDKPEKRPTLSLLNVGGVSRKCVRNTEELTVPGSMSMDLEDGDVVSILSNVPVAVKWEPIVCYCPSEQKTRPDLEVCAKLGVSLLYNPCPEVTHHLIPTYSLTPAIAASLISQANLVKPEWLESLLSSGTSEDEDTPVDFSLPPIAKFRPGFTSALPSSLKNHRSWEPNGDRTNMLNDYRIIFVGERGREARTDYRDLVRRGGATYECCPVQGGRKALHDVLAKAESKGKQPILIADETAMVAAVGQDSWNELIDEAISFELRFIHAEKLTQAVVHIDRSYLDCSVAKPANEDEPMPDVILNTNPDEPSQPPASVESDVARSAPASKRKLVRRVTSRPTSRASSPSRVVNSQTQPEASSSNTPATPAPVEEPKEPATPARRPLKRRFPRAMTPIVGIDDPSTVDEDAVMSIREPSKEPEESRPPPSQPRTSRLKRRFGTDGHPVATQSSPAFTYAPPEEDEPTLKKYRELFEMTDPDKITQSSMEEYKNMFKSQTSQDQGGDQPISQSTHTQAKRGALPAVPEEEEESTQTQMRDRVAALKRKTPEQDKENGASDAEEASRAAKTAGQWSIRMRSNRLSAAGEPDKDEKFLMAVASTKRGRKREDDFDREFNDLRISKPDLQSQYEEAAREWAVLEQFGDDGDIRGNFMVILELDVFKKDDGPRDALRTVTGRTDWDGRPNFKKFKQKAVHDRKEPIELILNEDSYEMDIDNDMYKDNQPMTVDFDEPFSPRSRSFAQSAQRASNAAMYDDSDDEFALRREDSPPPTLAWSQVQSRTSSVEPRAARKANTSKTTTTTKGKGKASQPLFMESDDDDMGPSPMEEDEEYVDKMIDDDGDESDELTLPTAGRRTQESRTAKSNSRKRAAVRVDDDSDNELRITRSKRARR
ncbi:hypothetical protein NM688_g1399 [Phlebia brevispora]|uniref:Uncharacterized protein n=1 Tax=Phlebia brevispora TaxID=194682 RepID=A0ACC1TBF9_9APHY|nr:hypothetical protein NM688_g1399 [Phlebia brevispora]